MAELFADFVTPYHLDDRDVAPLNMEGHRDTSYELKLPSDADASQGHRAILAFTLHATDPDDLHLQVSVGWRGHMHTVWDYTINSNVLHTVHQLIPAEILKAGTDNFANVHLASGDGHVRVENVVLWYHRTGQK